jgi:hypothetical protein
MDSAVTAIKSHQREVQFLSSKRQKQGEISGKRGTIALTKLLILFPHFYFYCPLLSAVYDLKSLGCKVVPVRVRARAL